VTAMFFLLLLLAVRKRQSNVYCARAALSLWFQRLELSALRISMGSMNTRPILLLTLGDVAGIGPEIIARSWPDLLPLCRPVVVGEPFWMQRALQLVESGARVTEIARPDEREAGLQLVPLIRGTQQELSGTQPGTISATAGRAAYDFLCTAINIVQYGAADGIVTAPLHKEGLRAAGLNYPGHTEILAERTGTRQFAMLLYCDG